MAVQVYEIECCPFGVLDSFFPAKANPIAVDQLKVTDDGSERIVAVMSELCDRLTASIAKFLFGGCKPFSFILELFCKLLELLVQAKNFRILRIYLFWRPSRFISIHPTSFAGKSEYSNLHGTLEGVNL
jgi:hypothetical protein